MLPAARLALALLVSIPCVAAPAQAEPGSVDHAPFPVVLEVTGAYLGELVTHPGAKGAAHYRLLHRDGSALSAGLGAGLFHHPGNATSAFCALEASGRAALPFSLFLDLSAGAGVISSFAAGPVYAVQGGVAAPILDSGFLALMPSLSAGIGLDLEHAGVVDLPVRISLRQFALGQVLVDGQVPLSVGAELALSVDVAPLAPWGIK